MTGPELQNRADAINRTLDLVDARFQSALDHLNRIAAKNDFSVSGEADFQSQLELVKHLKLIRWQAHRRASLHPQPIKGEGDAPQ